MTLLTIAVPTYNRADRLDRQLAWLHRVTAGHGTEVEVLVSDNASPDDTQDVVARWRHRFEPDVTLQVFRNAENVGVMGNIGRCITRATGRHLWLLGDDDDVSDDTLERFLDELRSTPQLELLCLNYSMWDVHTGEQVKARRYELDDDWTKDGPGPLEAIDDAGVPILLGLGFMSALVYRTDTLRAAHATWADHTNLEIQIYWSGVTAAAGPVRVTSDVHVRYNCGDNVLADRRNWYQCRNHDAPVVYRRLLDAGYSPGFSRQLILSPVLEPHQAKALVLGFLRWPALGLRSVAALGAGFSALQAHTPPLVAAPPPPAEPAMPDLATP